MPPSAPRRPRRARWTLFSTRSTSTPASSFSMRIASPRRLGSRYFCQVSRGSSTCPSASTVSMWSAVGMKGPPAGMRSGYFRWREPVDSRRTRRFHPPRVDMDWKLRDVPAELRARYQRDGHWTDDTFARFLEREVGAAPTLPFRVWSDTHPFSGTIGGLYEQSLRMASGLAR